MAKNKLYFVYGDSMNVGRMKKWLSQFGGRPDGILSAQRAVLKGWTLAFNVRREVPWKAGVANLEESAKGSVEGVLLEVDNATEGLLLRKEGGSAAVRRASVSVVGDKERVYDGVTLLVPSTSDGKKTHAPSKAYVELMLQAAKDFEFSPEYQKKLQAVKTAE